MPRLFLGVEIPETIAERLQGLRGGLRNGRWVEAENYHVTLRFIGDIDDAMAADIADLLGSVQRQAFSLKLDGLGSFGGKRPRAIWARVGPSSELLALQLELEQICQRAGLPPEARKYTPHLTIARLRGTSSNEVADYLSQNGDLLCSPFEVNRFALYSAKPSIGGGPYIVEQTFALSKPPDGS